VTGLSSRRKSPQRRPDASREPARDRALVSLNIPTVMDIEASGFGKGSYPIEVGYVLASGRRFCSLIRPRAEWTHWDEEAERLHGISRIQAERHGRPVEAICERLTQDLRGEVVYTDAWAQDWAWINLLYDSCDRLVPFRMESVRTLIDDARIASWHPTLEAARRELVMTRHRASSDAATIQLALCRLLGESSAAA